MTQAMGSKGQLGYQVESTFATMPASPALKKFYFNSEGIQEKVNLVTSSVIRGNRNPTKPVRGNRDVSGSFKTELAPELGTLLRAALGTVSTSSTGSPTSYTHTIKVGDLPSLLIEKGFTDLPSYLLYQGCKVNQFSLSAKAEGYQEVSFDLMGAYEGRILKYKTQTSNFTVGATVTGGTSGATGKIMADVDGGTTGILTLINISGTFQNAETITDDSSPAGSATVDGTLGSVSLVASYTDPGHSPFDGFRIATIQEGGSDIANITEVAFTVNNNLDGGTYAIGGGGIRRSLPEGKVKVSGTITALFESMSLYNKACQTAESSLKLIYEHGTGAGTDGNESLEIFVPELYFSQETPVIDGDKGILYKGPFEAFYDNAAEASAMQITLKNAESSI